MFAIAIGIWTATIGCKLPEPIEIREFSLTTSFGQNVFQEKFAHNTLKEASDRLGQVGLGLNFDAFGKHFTFELQRISVFDPAATVRIIDNVCGQSKLCQRVICY